MNKLVYIFKFTSDKQKEQFLLNGRSK